jgi:SAM-dependent methyltransferase
VKPLLSRAQQAAGRYVDWRLGIETAREMGRAELGYDAARQVGYEASRWFTLRCALTDVEAVGRDVVSEGDVFVDLGSGKGRVCLEAARLYPFSRVIGVEVSPELNEIAAANLRRLRRPLRCPQVDFVTADAATWDPPDDLTIAYMFNPFRGELFSAVVSRLLALVDRRGAPLRLIYVNPTEHARLMRTGRVRQLPSPAGLRQRLMGVPGSLVHRYELRPDEGTRHNSI